MVLQPWEAVGQVSVAGQRSTRVVARCTVRELSPDSSNWQLRAPSGLDLVSTTQYASALAGALANEGHVAHEVVVEARLFVTRLGDVETLGQVSLSVRVTCDNATSPVDVEQVARQVARGHARWSELRDEHLQVNLQAHPTSSTLPADAPPPRPARTSLRAAFGLRR
ncbi:MAG TPA: hypothetical protein VGQ62_14315 [Chloroflexota bacterium]|jgi:hypothetical protein|nr:hypothetical protein [Chloroflexota bacterium]